MTEKKPDTPQRKKAPFRKLKIIYAGLRVAIFSDFNVGYKFAVSLIAIACSLFLIEWLNFIVILPATGLMLIVEILNTVVESLCDYIQPGHEEAIKVIKDMSAAAAGIAFFIWVIVLVHQAIRLWMIFQPSQ